MAMGRVLGEAREQLVITCTCAGDCVESPGVVWSIKGLPDCYTHTDQHTSSFLYTLYFNILYLLDSAQQVN